MVLLGSASTGPTKYDGQFLESMDFEAFDGRGDLKLTPKLARAKRFASMEEAWAFLRRVPVKRALRPDGEPNRPMTAMHWEFKPL
jgi:hypothetical protein